MSNFKKTLLSIGGSMGIGAKLVEALCSGFPDNKIFSSRPPHSRSGFPHPNGYMANTLKSSCLCD